MQGLDEDVFSLDKKGIEEMEDFLKNDDDPFKKLTVIDTEATDEEDLKDSYEGKVIISCPVCHADVFEDPATLEIEEDMVTVHHECPYCHTTDEFTIKGQVVPFEVKTEEKEEEVEDESLTEDQKDKFAIGTLIKHDFDKINSFTTKEEIINLLDSYKEKSDDEKYLAMMKAKIALMPFRKAIIYLGDVALASEGNRTTTGKIRFDKDRRNTESLKEDDQAASVVDKYQKWVDYDMKKYHRISDITKRKLDDAGFEVVKDDHGDYEVIAKELNESIDVHIDRENEDITIETDGLKVDTSDKDVHIEEKEDEEIVDVLEPVSAETEEEILDKNEMVDTEEVEETEDEVKDTEDEEEVEIGEFDESLFNKLGTTYLRENYSNVRNFEVSTVRENIKDNTLVVEGIINFNNGNKRSTRFVFEGKTISKTGRVKLLGENADIGTGKNAFTLRAQLNNNKMICESLSYRYDVKDNDKTVQVIGKAKISK